MLESLHVKNLALIDEQEITFTEGMNILTGETGAGKSILIGSVNLALGAKAGKDYIRTGADYALVELIFSLNDQQCSQIREMDLPIEEDKTLILQRKITPGRSICRANGESISAGQLKNLAGCLLDMYGQHEHQSLLKPAAYKKMLDDYIGEKVVKLKTALKDRLAQYRKYVEELENQNSDETVRTREAKLLAFEIEEIENAALNPEEDEQVEKRYRRLVNAKRMKETVYMVHGLTGYENEGSAGLTVGHALREIKTLRDFDEDIAPLIGQLTDIDDLLNDFNRSMAQYEDSLEFDEEEFVELEDRLNTLNHLKDKYGDTIASVLKAGEEKQEELDKLNNYEAYMSGLREKINERKQEILTLCGQISKLRKKASGPLTKKLKEAMVDLNFLDVEFSISVEEQEEDFSADGYDKVDFLISTNPGEELRPLWQIASGGELSRIMLAFKTVFADKDETDTLVFDEIDTGISGKTAWKVSEKLGRLARNHQIICITHLAQIAAMADTHFMIEKNIVKDRTVTSIREISADESLGELARLLGSGKLTQAVLNNAREMQETARKVKEE
ncbi:DNA repair protein RecN [Parablautia intestinalis]|jgi:DNA repair protein RecN (Recombination protein N)|uniref:DNA repair protein RecN n=1 Tax=Parablautia intestinalis TaxID=2320100 RepID=A0A3A9AQD7_9FIRM|nr:DNA repair protein RecN [Parablautia intestinalis]MCI8615709.1 DNA repair protein RecN [Lachnospiraceae bacterium]RKI93588.1 DNA repair protein RecN [Parablautia intestinalis]